MIGSAIVAVLVLANMSAIYLSRLSSYKDHDKGIVSNFMSHYLENVQAIEFDNVITNQPINGLYTGSAGTPNLRIPSSSSWISLVNTNYLTFHPDLIWITNRNPQMRVVFTTTMSGGLPHTKHLQMEVKWDPPLGFGGTITRRLDLLRVRDL